VEARSQRVHALIVDDEESVRLFLRETLRRADYNVETVSSGADALEILRNTRFDVVLLDLNLGGRIDGIRVLQSLRWLWPDAAAVILTAHGSLGSAMAAINEGVDGYLLKPVEPEEIRRAIAEALERRSQLRGAAAERPAVIREGSFTIDIQKHRVASDGRAIDLTPNEFAFFVYLVENADRVLTPKELVQAVAGFEADSAHEARQTVKWYVHQLRKKIEPDPARPQHILNVRGVGYRFSG